MSEVSIVGRVKWYDSSRGFGFLVSEQIEGDVLVHHSVLKPHHRRAVPEGALLEVTAELRERGWQASQVLSIDTRDALPLTPRSHGRPKCLDDLGEVGDWEFVDVKWYDGLKGYGFVVRRSGDEAFAHAEVVKAAKLHHVIVPGMELQARIGVGQRGFAVSELRYPVAH